MSLARYIAIVFPFKAQVWLSNTRTIRSGVAVWFIAALCGACEVVFGSDIVSFCLTFIFEITILVTLLPYYKIAIKLRQRRMFLTSLQPPGTRVTRAIVDLSARLPADDGRGRPHDLHCSAVRGRHAHFPRPTSVHSGQVRPEFTTFL